MQSDSLADDDELSGDETHRRRKDPNAITEEEEEEFNRELAKMLANTGEPRKVVERKSGLLDVGVPLARRKQRVVEGEEEVEEMSTSKGLMFTLLTKSGNKQKVGSILSNA